MNPLHGCIVSFTGFDPVEEGQLTKSAQSLGAIVTRTLTREVTHLILNRVGTDKHKVAVQLKITCLEVMIIVLTYPHMISVI